MLIGGNAHLLQEDPFKLVIVAKEVQRLGIMTADFLFTSDGDFVIAASDEEGVIRLLEFDPEGMKALLSPLCCFNLRCSNPLQIRSLMVDNIYFDIRSSMPK